MNAQFDWLIGHEPSVTAEHQRRLTASENRRDLGILRAQNKAHSECGEEWTAHAATFIYHYASEVAKGQPFLLEDAREIAHRPPYNVPEQSNARAWGGAIQYAARKGWIKKSGYAPARSSNLSPKCLWQLAK